MLTCLQKPSEYMRDFKENHAQGALDGLAAREAEGLDPRACATCAAPVAEDDSLFRCFDCHTPPVNCRACLLKAHTHLPFHFVQQWDPKRRFWHRVPLTALGVVLYVGHEGHPCSYVRTDPRPMHVVSTHGVHNIKIGFCACPDPSTGSPRPDAVQLLASGFWPASWDRPQTVFTIQVLKDFTLLSNQAHVNAHDYYEVLRRKTDNVGSHKVTVRLALCLAMYTN